MKPTGIDPDTETTDTATATPGPSTSPAEPTTPPPPKAQTAPTAPKSPTPPTSPASPGAPARLLSVTLSALAPLADLPPFRTLPLPSPLSLARGLLPLPGRLAGISTVLVKATALELAILAGHLVLYPSGLAPERRASRAPAPAAADVPTTGPQGPPVLLLHGFIDNRSVFVLLRRALSQHGTRHLESLNYSPLTCDIKAAATLLGRHVEELCERTGQDRIDIVGHSLGGLIARYYVQRLGGDRRVRTVVTLGTPHSGTEVAPLADAHPIVRQMRPGSAVIEELSRPAPGCATRFVSFWSDLDQLMVPLETACVDHPDLIAQNVRVTGIGHLALPVHPAVAAAVREALAPDPAQGARAADTRGGLTVA